MHNRIRVIGIDPGLRRMGWGVIEVDGNRLSAVAHGTVAPPTQAPLSDRLQHLYEELGGIVEQYQPHEAAIEEAFMANNAASAMKLGHARAAAMLAPATRGIAVSEYAARLVKKTVVGTGAADKDQIAAMIAVLLPGTKAEADAADALAIAVCHAHHRKALSIGSAA